MANDLLRSSSGFDQRVANELALRFTGCSDVDKVQSRRPRVTGESGRTAMIEVKALLDPNYEPQRGQNLTYTDLVGTLITPDGRRFEQRAYLVQELATGGALLCTWSGRKGDEIATNLMEGSVTDVIGCIATWVETGRP